MTTNGAPNTLADRARLLIRLAWRASLGLLGTVIWLAISILHAAARTWAVHVSRVSAVDAGAPERWLLPGGGDPVAGWLRAVVPPHAGLMPAEYLWMSLFWASVVIPWLVLSTMGWQRFLRLVAMYAVVIFAADAVFALVPTMPPWMADGTPRLLYSSVPAMRYDTNPTAALPSLHVALPTLTALWFLRHEHRAFRWIGALLAVRAVLMAWAVIYTGEHWVLDCTAGAALAAGVYFAFDRLGWAQARATSRGARVTPIPAEHPALEPAAA